MKETEVEKQLRSARPWLGPKKQAYGDEPCQACTHTRFYHWNDGKCRDACHCPRFVAAPSIVIDREGMILDLIAMAAIADDAAWQAWPDSDKREALLDHRDECSDMWIELSQRNTEGAERV